MTTVRSRFATLFGGPGRFLKFESTWHVTDAGLRLTTVVPMGGSR